MNSLDESEIIKYVVRINEGSGIAFQPSDERYTYIFTAKHVLENQKGNTSFFYFSEAQQCCEKRTDLKLKEGDNYFPHDHLDIAILKVERLDCARDLILYHVSDSQNDNHSLAGYPGLRKETEKELVEEVRIDRILKIYRLSKYKKEAELGKMFNIKEIEGMSGGAIFKIHNGLLQLTGIQYSIPGYKKEIEETKIEQLARVSFVPAEALHEIVEKFPAILELIRPYYMKSFTHVENEVMNLDRILPGSERNRIKGMLKEKAKKTEITPNEISRSELVRLMMIDKEPRSTLYSKKLWMTWLEYLVILSISKEKTLTLEDVRQEFYSVRLLCSNTDKDWTRIMKEILSSNFEDLGKNSTVIIGVQSLPGGSTEIKPSMIRDIAEGLMRDDPNFRIDLGSPILGSLTFVHIKALEEKIDKKWEILKLIPSANAEELINHIKTMSDEIFGK